MMTERKKEDGREIQTTDSDRQIVKEEERGRHRARQGIEEQR